MKFFISLIGFILILSCTQNKVKEISFYHWKSKATYNSTVNQALNDCKSKKIYMHFFDIETLNKNRYDDGIYPTYVLKEVDARYKDYDIIPVVYITNQVLKNDLLDINDLAKKITDLVHQISQHQFNKTFSKIQIDCDWTQSTKNTYFELLTILKSDFDINVTIRLHQIKYQQKTGVPPVKNGTLMLYNMGDLKNENQNSILESSIVKQYINKSSQYPLKLKLALPIFSQTILTNSDGDLKIIKNTNRQLYESDAHFKSINHNLFEVVKDTLYKGFYLTPANQLKLEEINLSEIIKSYQIIQDSKIDIDEIIFYHLDENSIKNVNLKSLINQL